MLHVRQVFYSKLRVVLKFWFASKCIRMGHSTTAYVIIPTLCKSVRWKPRRYVFEETNV